MRDMDNYGRGIKMMLACQFIWGSLPIYWKSLIPIDSIVIIYYRVFMVALVACVAAFAKYPAELVKAPLKDKKKIKTFFIAGLLITLNWSTYIWAVNAGFLVQASIGYYIEPLVICLLGIIVFHEKLTGFKLTAMILAFIAVLVILIYFRQLPGIALALAGTFAVYSAIKKTVTEPALISLFYETVFLAPIALVIIIYLEAKGRGALGVGEPYQYVLLLLCGVATVAPMGLFSSAVQRVPLFVIGIISYLNPSIQLLMGIFIFHEAFDKVQLLSFCIIWLGLIVFSYGEYRDSKE